MTFLTIRTGSRLTSAIVQTDESCAAWKFARVFARRYLAAWNHFLRADLIVSLTSLKRVLLRLTATSLGRNVLLL